MFIVTLLFPLIDNVKAWYGEIDMLICHNSNAGTYISKVMFRDILNQDKQCHCFFFTCCLYFGLPYGSSKYSTTSKNVTFHLSHTSATWEISRNLKFFIWLDLIQTLIMLFLTFALFFSFSQWILYWYTRGSVRGQCLVKTLSIGWHQYVSSDICRVNAKQTWLCCCSVVLW